MFFAKLLLRFPSQLSNSWIIYAFATFLHVKVSFCSIRTKVLCFTNQLMLSVSHIALCIVNTALCLLNKENGRQWFYLEIQTDWFKSVQHDNTLCLKQRQETNFLIWKYHSTSHILICQNDLCTLHGWQTERDPEFLENLWKNQRQSFDRMTNSNEQ